MLDDAIYDEQFLNSSESFDNVNNIADKYIKEFSEHLKPLNIKKLPLPHFDGKIRSYPRFKRDFLDLLLPQVPKLQAACTLRHCLSPDVQAYV